MSDSSSLIPHDLPQNDARLRSINDNHCSLFVFVDETRFGTGVYPSFTTLLESFNPQLGEADDALTNEINAFLDAVMETEVMQIAQGCLADWGDVIIF